jgi:hypothetical protein
MLRIRLLHDVIHVKRAATYINTRYVIEAIENQAVNFEKYTTQMTLPM